MTREQRIATTFVELADSLVDDFDVVDLMVLLTERCVELLDASSAGLLLADPSGNLNLMAATNETTEAVELFQVQRDEGPCRDCFHSGAPVSTVDLASAADRWPVFAPVAARAGLRAVHAIPMRLRGIVLGALGLFRIEPVPLERSELATAQALADVASIAILSSRGLRDAHVLADQLESTLNSRIAVEQAKGIVAERLQCGMDEAFARLRLFARANRTGVTKVAFAVVDGSLSTQALTTR